VSECLKKIRPRYAGLLRLTTSAAQPDRFLSSADTWRDTTASHRAQRRIDDVGFVNVQRYRRSFCRGNIVVFGLENSRRLNWVISKTRSAMRLDHLRESSPRTLNREAIEIR